MCTPYSILHVFNNVVLFTIISGGVRTTTHLPVLLHIYVGLDPSHIARLVVMYSKAGLKSSFLGRQCGCKHNGVRVHTDATDYRSRTLRFIFGYDVLH